MKFTIVTPSLNQGEYIGRTIDSVIRQEGDFKIQYLVRDGGSTDQTVDILRQTDKLLASGADLGNRGVEFSWVSRKDGGQSAAINAGLREAAGDIVAYLNSDDAYLPAALAAVAQAFQDKPEADFVYGDGTVIDEYDNLQWVWLSRPYNFKVLTRHHEAWNEASNYISQASTFWRRSVGERMGLFDEAFQNAMDLEYWIRGGSKGMRFEHIPVELSQFRLIQGTKSLSSPTVFWPDTIEIYRRYAPESLLTTCAYYFYNLVLAHQWDLAAAEQEYDRQLRETHRVPADEAPAFEAVKARGRRLGKVICAIDALRRGDDATSDRLYAEATREGGFGLHPVVWRYRVRRALGVKGRAWFENAVQRWVASYKKRKVDYRYSEAKSE